MRSIVLDNEYSSSNDVDNFFNIREILRICYIAFVLSPTLINMPSELLSRNSKSQ